MATFTTFLKLYKPVTNEEGWDDNMNSNLDVIDGFVKQFMSIPGFTGAWVNAHAYGINNVALDTASGSFYTVLVAHTSASTGSFAADRTARPTLWKLTNNVSQDAAAAAAASATQSANSATAAAGSATSAAASFNSFRTVYYGAFATDPATDPIGGARTAGDMYYNTTTPRLRVWSGTAWADVPSTQGMVPEAPNNGTLYGRRSLAWTQAMGVTGNQQLTDGNLVIASNVGNRQGKLGVGYNPPDAADPNYIFANNINAFSTHTINLYFSSVDGRWHYALPNIVASGWATTTPTTGLPIMYFFMTGETPGVANSTANLRTVMTIDRGGNLLITGGVAGKVGGGVWSDVSDERIKTVIGPYSAGLAEILEMEPKVFTYKGNDYAIGEGGEKGQAMHPDTTTNYIGFVAQECETYMPELVTQYSCYIDDTLETDVRRVDATALLYACVNAIRTLEARIAVLEAA